MDDPSIIDTGLRGAGGGESLSQQVSRELLSKLRRGDAEAPQKRRCLPLNQNCFRYTRPRTGQHDSRTLVVELDRHLKVEDRRVLRQYFVPSSNSEIHGVPRGYVPLRRRR